MIWCCCSEDEESEDESDAEGEEGEEEEDGFEKIKSAKEKKKVFSLRLSVLRIFWRWRTLLTVYQ